MSLFQFLQIPNKILVATAIWPKPQASFSYNIRSCFTQITLIGLFISLAYNAAVLYGDILKFSESLYMLISVLNSVVKTEMLCLNGEAFLKLFERLEKQNFQKSEQDYPNLFKNYGKLARKFAVVYLFLVNSCLFFIFLHPVKGSKSLPMDFPYFNNGAYYVPFYLFQSISLTLSAYQNVGLDLLVNMIILITAVQFKVLNRNLINMDINVQKTDFGDSEKETLIYLNECCIQYTNIEEIVTDIIDIFSVHIFVQLGSSVVAICNSGIMLLTVNSTSVEVFSLASYIVAMVTEVGMYCWFGNLIFIESAEVLTSCYLTKWYEHGTTVRKTLFMLMERSKRPLQIKGLKYVNLSFITFITILKWSYSYFALLRNYTYNIKN